MPDYNSDHVRYFHTNTCAEPGETFIRNLNINENEECLFHNLLVLMKSNLNFHELKNSLKYSKYIQLCEDPKEAYWILILESTGAFRKC